MKPGKLDALLDEIIRLEAELIVAEEDVREAEEAREEIDNSLDFAHRQAAKLMRPGVVVEAGRYRFVLDDDDRVTRVPR